MMIFHRSPRTYLSPPTAELELQPPLGKPPSWSGSCSGPALKMSERPGLANHQGTKTQSF